MSPAVATVEAWVITGFLAAALVAIPAFFDRLATRRRAAAPADVIMVRQGLADLGRAEAGAERLAGTGDWMRLADVLLCRDCVVAGGLFLPCPAHDTGLWQQFEQAAQ